MIMVFDSVPEVGRAYRDLPIIRTPPRDLRVNTVNCDAGSFEKHLAE